MVDFDITDSDSLEISSELEIYIQEIIMLLNGERADVMGAYDMAIDLERLVFETKIDSAELRDKIDQKIKTYTSFSDIYQTTTKISFAKGTERDICLLDIIIDGSKKLSIIIR